MVPALVAAAFLAMAAAAAFYFNPHREGELRAVRTDTFIPETTFKAPAMQQKGMNIVGQAPQVERSFYAVITVHIQNDHRLPLFVDDVEGRYEAAGDGELATTAPGTAADLRRIEEVFPKLRDLMPHPLFRGDTVPPKSSLDGQVLLSFGTLSADDWSKRKPSEITVNFTHQNPMTATIP